MRHTLTPAFILAGLVFTGTAAAQPAKKKTPPACGAKILPLVVGNSWKYMQVSALTPVRDDLAKIVPPAAKSVVVTVKKIEAKGPETVVTLEEVTSYEAKSFKRLAPRGKGKPKKDDKPDDKKDEAKKEKDDDTVTVTSTITCDAKGRFEISPESFFFAGEPGGSFDVELTKVERKKDAGWKLAQGNIQENEWTEELYATWKRSAPKGFEAEMGSGRFELERRFVPQAPEPVNTRSEDGLSIRTWPKAEKIQLVVTGRVFLDNSIAPEKKPCSIKEPEKDAKGAVVKDDKGNEKMVDKLIDHCPLPANWINEMWLVLDVGMIQVVNTYAHRYNLVKYDVDR
ncbi:MAG: hypothetical protein KIT31_09615 [Deltaproteobacteria bacterium]|nr:hypothetical protein [Deltaproteobacteria bacterium]